MKKDKLITRLKKQSSLQLMALPAVIWLIVFAYIPMMGLIIMFKDYRVIYGIMESPWTSDYGMHHFISIFEDPQFYTALYNTIGMSLLRLLIAFPAPIIFALLLNELNSSGLKRWVQTITYMPHFLSWVVLGGMMISWFSDSGLVNQVMLQTGVINEPIPYLTDPNGFWLFATLTDLWKELGWGTIIYLAAISGVDPALYEAALVDGANRFQRMWYITFPAILGAVLIMFILAVSGLLSSNFDQILVLGNPLNKETSNVLSIYIYQKGILGGGFSFATAVGFIQAVVGMLLLVGSNLTIKKIRGKGLFE